VIAALYVQTGGAYFGLPNVDPWDIHRDARTYAGPWPVVAHPPCERWSKCAHIHGRIGEDDGCFGSALVAVETWGGVLEHPAGSEAWRRYGIPTPAESTKGWFRTIRGGWTCLVDQGNYGHRSRKLTWLYWCGHGAPTPLIWGTSDKPALVQKSLGKKERSRTPLPFRDVLIGLATLSAIYQIHREAMAERLPDPCHHASSVTRRCAECEVA